MRKPFAIQAISYIKIPVEIKSARKHSQMLPDSQNLRTFSSMDDSQYMVFQMVKQLTIIAPSSQGLCQDNHTALAGRLHMTGYQATVIFLQTNSGWVNLNFQRYSRGEDFNYVADN